MNKKIMEVAGFSTEMNLISENKCPFCCRIINTDDFKDELSVREYKITGLCQECQDRL